MHPKLLIRTVRRPRLELFSIDLEYQRLLLFPTFQRNFELEDRMLFRNRCTRLSDLEKNVPSIC
jgi:hypothetical protein